MRHAIETAPRGGKVVILEHDASETYDVAHGSAETGEWVGENGDPSKIAPTHWHPMPSDKYLLQEDEGSSNASQVGPSSPRARRRFAASSITATVIVAALIGLYFEQEIQWKTDLLALQQYAEADQARARAQEPAEVKQAASAPEARQSLEKEQRAQILANELAEARRVIDGLNLQLRTEAANTAQLLGQEREKTVALTQELIAARQELTANPAQDRQALDEERARGAALASELAMARREIEANVALLNKARDDAAQFKQTAEKTTVGLQQERDGAEAAAANSAQLLGQEREKTVALTQELTAARQELTASPAQHRQVLDEERARGAALASELAMARREIEANVALLNKARDDAAQFKQTAEKTTVGLQQERDGAEAEAANSAQLLGQERPNATAARQELTATTAQHRQALEEERARRAALWSELAEAQREIETQAALLRKASDETKQLEQATESAMAELRQSLQQERDAAEAAAANSAQLLEQERQNATAARQELTASAAQHRQALDEESARGAALASELAMARREIEANVALLNKARDDAAQVKQTAEKTTVGPQQERDGADALSQKLAMAPESAQPAIDTRATLKHAANSQVADVTQAVEEPAPKQPASQGPDLAKLMARASALLDQGNISAARLVLERAAETGSALASFTLAETYDPAILSTSGTYGTRGDATKARELYAKAHARGIQKAKDRLDALDQ
ncbi:hypothetical protein [Bradyrhizobium sp. URHD0069]|uniref:hypothetical protein n=1 Tax=Bradyrhizobium sp. URHD0069 TaxID=1380355 RepID=UPI0004972066|nr:hypothetical protein [Bradyrhizobium sp. URHD0069]